MLYLIGIAVVVAIAAAVLLRPSPKVPSHPDIIKADSVVNSGMTDNVVTGQMLAYLVGNFLIDSQQYQAWRGLKPDELKLALGEAGIMTDAEFDSFNQQIAAEIQLQKARGEFSYQEKVW